jgi:hypothetical protein
MTFRQLLKIANDYQLSVLRRQDAFIRNRRFGVQLNPISDGELLDLKLLQELVEGNEATPLYNPFELPVWMPATLFDAFIATILKRTLL